MQIAAATAAMALGSLVQGGVGFGAALIAAPLLALVDTRFIPGPIALATSLLNVALILRTDRSGYDHEVRWAMLGLVPGTIAAGATLSVLSAHALSITFAVLVIVAVAVTGFGHAVRRRHPTLFAAGTASGYMGTISGIGGPPIALLYQQDPGRTLRATLPRYFLASSAITLVTLAAIGRLGEEEAALALVLVPGVLLGLLGGPWLAGHVDRRTARPFVLTLSLIAAVSVLVKELV